MSYQNYINKEEFLEYKSNFKEETLKDIKLIINKKIKDKLNKVQ